MLKNTGVLFRYRTFLIPLSETKPIVTGTLKWKDSGAVCDLCNKFSRIQANSFHKSAHRLGGEDRRALAATMPKRDEGADGEKSVDIDSVIQSKGDIFPDVDLPNRLFNGVPFKDVPVVHIKATKNNTILSITDSDVVKVSRSCGMEGFKNTRKGTNIAAQATAISFTTRLLDKGFKTVRVKVQGLGPGRMSAIKGLQMAGLNIISVTDNTPVSWCPPRPRKQRRI